MCGRSHTCYVTDYYSNQSFFSSPCWCTRETAIFVTAHGHASQSLELPCRCLLDTKPRHFSPGEAAVLNNFSELVIREMEAAWVESTAAQQKLLRSPECYGQPYLVVDMAPEGGHILHMSSSAQILTGERQGRSMLQHTVGLPIMGGGLLALVLRWHLLTPRCL